MLMASCKKTTTESDVLLEETWSEIKFAYTPQDIMKMLPLCLRVGLQLAVNLYHYLYYYPSLVLEFHGFWISWFGNEVKRKSSLVGNS
jgi:hypothetical protein